MCMHHDHKPEDCKDQDKQDMLSKRRFVQALASGGVLVATPALNGCATNPETGSSQMLLVGESQLNKMAAQSWTEMKKTQKLSKDPRYTKRLKNIGSRIAKGSRRDGQSWDFAVLDEDDKNAFVLPGNRVGFYKGMMDFADNDDQIGAVMGHEVGHVVGRHAAERYSQQMLAQGATTVGTVVASTQFSKACRNATTRSEYNNCMRGANRNTAYLAQALGIGFTVGLVLPYSRGHESQSDLLGARYMQRAGYDPYESVKLWEKMAENNTRRVPEFMSTHPDPARRARDLHDYISCQERLGSQGWGDETLKEAIKNCSAQS